MSGNLSGHCVRVESFICPPGACSRSLCINSKAHWLSISASQCPLAQALFIDVGSKYWCHLLFFPIFKEVFAVFHWIRGSGYIVFHVDLGVPLLLYLEPTTGAAGPEFCDLWLDHMPMQFSLRLGIL